MVVGSVGTEYSSTHYSLSILQSQQSTVANIVANMPKSIGHSKTYAAPGPRGHLVSGLVTLQELSVRSYLVGNAGSRPISEAKQPWACLVLRWGTTGEAHVLYSLNSLCQQQGDVGLSVPGHHSQQPPLQRRTYPKGNIGWTNGVLPMPCTSTPHSFSTKTGGMPPFLSRD